MSIFIHDILNTIDIRSKEGESVSVKIRANSKTKLLKANRAEKSSLLTSLFLKIPHRCTDNAYCVYRMIGL